MICLATRKANAAVSSMVGNPCDRGANDKSATHKPSGKRDGFI